MTSIIITVMSFENLKKLSTSFYVFFGIFVYFHLFSGTEVMGSGKELMERLLFYLR